MGRGRQAWSRLGGKGQARQTTRAEQPTGRKKPQWAEDPSGTDGMTPLWSFARGDFNGPWPPTGEQFGKVVIPKLAEYETHRWADIQRATHGHRGSKSHQIEVTKFEKDPRDRLAEIHVDEDSLFSLRLSGKQRVYGIRRGRVLEILWYDPDHVLVKSTNH